MNDPLDRYYTPVAVADDVARAAYVGGEIECCVDTACGRGSLLLAAERRFPRVAVIGIDRDSAAIRFLRRAKPRWQVSEGDVLSPRSVRNSLVGKGRKNGVLLLNPPFSARGQRVVSTEFGGVVVRSSVAMAHILSAVQIFGSGGGAAIVPESLLRSETDAFARSLLSSVLELREVSALGSSTFRGTRANALIVQIRPTRMEVGAAPRIGGLGVLNLVRGGLPLFEARWNDGGLQYIHSTDIPLVVSGGQSHLRRVAPIGRGTVSGNVVLLPRVGLPQLELIAPIVLKERVQLSDCVFALRFRTLQMARTATESLRRRFDTLRASYRGTGARFITNVELSTLIGVTETE